MQPRGKGLGTHNAPLADEADLHTGSCIDISDRGKKQRRTLPHEDAAFVARSPAGARSEFQVNKHRDEHRLTSLIPAGSARLHIEAIGVVSLHAARSQTPTSSRFFRVACSAALSSSPVLGVSLGLNFLGGEPGRPHRS